MKIKNYIRGDSRTINIQVYQSDGITPFDLTGATVYFTVNPSSNPTDDTSAAVSKNVTSHTNAILGQTAVALLPADTSSLTPAIYYYDAQVKDSFGNVFSLPQGQFEIVSDITRRTT